jgi:hypothetical protein
MDPSLSQVVIKLYPHLEANLHQGRLYFKIAKYLYGLKQAARKFYEYMSEFFLSEGFQMSNFDNCLFTKNLGSNQIIDCCLHVDDIFVTAPTQQDLDNFRVRLKEVLQVEEHLYSPYSFLGMTITRDLSTKTAKITMTSMIDKLVDKYVPDMTSKFTPYTPSLLIDDVDDSDVLSPQEQKTFVSITMAILYIARFCRFDTLLSPTLLASKLKKASKIHMQEVLRVLRYYKATREMGPIFGGIATNGIILAAISDASHAIFGGRGIGALALTLGAAAIAIKCWILKMATLSSTESELLATTEVATYIIWARALLASLGHPQPAPTPLYQDNKASIIMNNQGGGSFKRSKHLWARHSFVTDYIGAGEFVLIFRESARIFVDMLTKVHSRTPFEQNRDDAHIE